MALSNFQYSKSWRSAEDFPTFEDSEEQVRDDMQSLFDEVGDALNRLAGEIGAANIPFEPTEEIDAEDVQAAIELLQAQLAGIALDQLPNGSVTAEKLAGFAVTTAKLADAAVTAAKLAAGAVSSAKLADGAVTGAKLADGAVTAEKLSAGALSGKADLVGGKVRPSQLSRSKSSVSASRTLALSDEGKALYCTNSSAVTLTIPDNASAAFPLGTEILIYRKGSGTVTVAAASGVTLLCPGQKLLASRYGSARLKKWDTNTWSLEGEGLAPAGYLNNFASGFAPAGAIRLTQGVHYAASQAQLPTPGTAGRVFLVAAD